jgi:hypothetical protein
MSPEAAGAPQLRGRSAINDHVDTAGNWGARSSFGPRPRFATSETFLKKGDTDTIEKTLGLDWKRNCIAAWGAA